MKKYILTIDAGTTGLTVILFDDELKIVDKEYSELSQIYPKENWVEHDPTELIDKIELATEKITKKHFKKNITSIGITNQRETVVLWDKTTGKSLYNAIVWQDRRTDTYCNELKVKGYEEFINQKTGLLLDPYFSSTKIRWIIDNVKGVKEGIDDNKVCAGTIDTWIIWHLTKGKVFATDLTNAARTNLFNIKDLKWDDDLLDLFGVNKSILPDVQESDGFYGKSEALVKKIPIHGVIGDQQSAAIGQKCFNVGDIKSTYGTGCFVIQNTGKEIAYSKNKLLSTIAYKVKGETAYALEGSIFMAGAIIDWLNNNLQVFDNYSELDDILINAEINPEVVMVPAFTGLGAPHWKPDSRASISGLTRDTDKNDIIIASIQSVSLQTYDLIKAIHEDTHDLFKKSFQGIKVDGGMTDNQWFLQNLSDICETKIIKSSEQEATALGAATLSALGSNEIYELSEFNINSNENVEFLPIIKKQLRSKIIKNWGTAINKTINN